MAKTRIGMGFDIHRTKMGVPLVLGGYEIDSAFGLVSNTDGDVVLHAIMDAVLACARLGDIGRLFPPEDFAGSRARSSELIKEVVREIRRAGLSLEQVDVTILAEAPRLSSNYEKIGQSISSLLEIPEESVTLKARSFEGLGEIGRGEAIAAYAIVLANLTTRRQRETSKARAPAITAIGVEARPGDEKGAYRLYTDGASRGNPGRSACGFILKSPAGKLLDSATKFLGVRTNNEAEYEGVILALDRVLELLGGKAKVILHLDSELVFNQIVGRYKIKDEKLRNLHQEVAKRLRGMEKLAFLLIPREANKQADELLRKLL